jgi:pimeloyl-ACP methyl ester carboxylesterase
MPYADNHGVQIHYRIEGSGQPLVLQHGFTESIEDWYECGYVGALKGDYQLILVDQRGHGKSDKPHEPTAYALDVRVADVAAVLDAAGVQKAHFWGYSMGAWIGFGMAQFASNRVDRLVIGAQHPFARSMEHLRQMIRAGIDGGTDAFLAAFQQTFGPAEGAFAQRLRSADLQALLALAQDRTGLDELLSEISVPCCLYAGEMDDICVQARAASQRIPEAIFFSLPGLDHCEAFSRADLVLPPVLRFLQSGELAQVVPN